MNYRDKTVFAARFSRLRLHAFGIDQVIAGTFDMRVEQLRANPPLWAAKPTMARAGHKWEADAPEIVMKLVEADFELMILPWRIESSAARPAGLSPAPTSITRRRKTG